MYLKIIVHCLAPKKSQVIRAHWPRMMWPLLAPDFVPSHSALHLLCFSQTGFFLFSSVPQPCLPECPCTCLGCSSPASPHGCYPLTLGAQLTQHLPGRSSLTTLSTGVSPKLIPVTLPWTLGIAFTAIIIVSTFL